MPEVIRLSEAGADTVNSKVERHAKFEQEESLRGL